MAIRYANIELFSFDALIIRSFAGISRKADLPEYVSRAETLPIAVDEDEAFDEPNEKVRRMPLCEIVHSVEVISALRNLLNPLGQSADLVRCA